MGLFSNRSVDTKRKRRTGPKSISLSSIHGGHSPDKRAKNAKKAARGSSGPPIEVEQSGWGYRLVDGCDRVHYARLAGKSSIRAYIWK
jgi:hypothetical protein